MWFNNVTTTASFKATLRDSKKGTDHLEWGTDLILLNINNFSPARVISANGIFYVFVRNNDFIAGALNLNSFRKPLSKPRLE